jgi:hypothetical protein
MTDKRDVGDVCRNIGRREKLAMEERYRSGDIPGTIEQTVSSHDLSRLAPRGGKRQDLVKAQVRSEVTT